MSSDEESSSDDSMPLSKLKKTQPVQKKAAAPIGRKSSSTSGKRSSSGKVINYKERDLEDSSENEWDEEELVENDDASSEGYDDSDDEPISLKKTKKASTPVKKKKKVEKVKKKKDTDTPKKKKKIKKSSSSASNNSGGTSSSSNFVCASSELYTKCEKGKLISEFLRRWWYAMTWPDPKDLPKTTPENCDAMDGFPGVYVVTSGDEVGKILDLRDKKTCPNFINMVQKSSGELRQLLLKAIAEQKRILIENEGEDTQTEKDLKRLEKWAQRVNASKADTDAEKVLKAAGLKINEQ